MRSASGVHKLAVQIREISESARAEGRGLRDQMKAQRDAMRALLDQDTPDQSTVMAQADAIGELKTQLRQNQLAAMLEVRALLTPEQRAELVKLHEERRERRHDRMGMRREMRREGGRRMYDRGDGPPPARGGGNEEPDEY